MKRLITPALGLMLASCSSLPIPLRDDDSGMKLARMTNRANDEQLTDAAVHEVLFAAYSRSRDPLMGGEDLEMINENLVRLRDRLGDERFAASLRRENPAVVSAVAWHLRPKASSGVFPISSEVLKQAPKKTFELEAAIARQ